MSEQTAPKGEEGMRLEFEKQPDPYTMDARLCDDDGVVRTGPMHHGTDYPCTGHAHYAGEHIKCLSPAHPHGLPGDLLAALGHEGLHSDESAVVRSAIRHTRELP